MKIYHILSNKDWAGTEVYAMSLAEEQRLHGHKVEIICADRPLIIKKFAEAGFKVHKMAIHGFLKNISALRIASLLNSSTEPTVIHVHRFIDTELVHNALKFVTSKKQPAFIATNHMCDPAPVEKKFNKIYKRIDRLLSVSRRAQQLFLSSAPTVDSDKLRVIINSTKKVAAHNYNHMKPGNTNEKVSLMTMGRIVKEKGIDTAIESLQYLPEATLTICGTGPEEYVSSLHTLARRLNVADRINWTGFTDKIIDYISRADIGIVPSRWEEPCALVNFEYLAAGVPLVTSNTGGQPEIITDGVEGFLVTPDDPQALAKAIRRLIDDPELRKKMGEAARKTFENRFTYDKFYNKVMRVYEEALSDKPSERP